MNRHSVGKNIFTIICLFLFNFFVFSLSSCSYENEYSFDDIKSEALENSISIYNYGPDIILSPEEGSSVGFIFYPGGYVEYTAYLNLMLKCAEKGITCILVLMLDNLAIYNLDAAKKYIYDFTEISEWYVGGHSLGGAMAAVFAEKNENLLSGIILLAAYSTKDISDSNLKVLSVYGSNDKILNLDNYQKYKSNLPDTAIEYVIEGGNHSNFGTYGFQKNDGTAAITAKKQQEITANYISEFIQ